MIPDGCPQELGLRSLAIILNGESAVSRKLWGNWTEPLPMVGGSVHYHSLLGSASSERFGANCPN